MDGVQSIANATIAGQRRSRRIVDALTCAVGIVCVVLTGCDSAPYEVVPVSGRVTLDGKPVADASVNTQPIGTADVPEPGPGSWGRTDADGQFTLELVNPAKSGAVVGEHRVTITTSRQQNPSDDAAPLTPELLPRKYQDGSVKKQVPSDGSEQWDFEITSSES